MRERAGEEREGWGLGEGESRGGERGLGGWVRERAGEEREGWGLGEGESRGRERGLGVGSGVLVRRLLAPSSSADPTSVEFRITRRRSKTHFHIRHSITVTGMAPSEMHAHQQ